MVGTSRQLGRAACSAACAPGTCLPSEVLWCQCGGILAVLDPGIA